MNPMDDAKLLFKLKFTNIKPLGHGSFGTVYLGTSPSGQLRAIKVLQQKGFTKGEQDAALALSRVNCPYIIQTYDIIQEDDKVVLEMEYANSRSLENIIKKNRPLSEADAHHFIYQILVGTQVVHDNHLLHRDLKPDNILLHQEKPDGLLIAKISDFGLARRLDPGHMAQTQCGTPLYMSPEVYLEGVPFDEKTDVWAIGVIFYQLLSSRLPFPAQSPAELMRMLQSPPPFMHYVSSDCWNVVSALLQRQAANRPTCRQALSMPFFTRFTTPLPGLPPPHISEHLPPHPHPLPHGSSSPSASASASSTSTTTPATSPSSSSTRPDYIAVHEAEQEVIIGSGRALIPSTEMPEAAKPAAVSAPAGIPLNVHSPRTSQLQYSSSSPSSSSSSSATTSSSPSTTNLSPSSPHSLPPTTPQPSVFTHIPTPPSYPSSQMHARTESPTPASYQVPAPPVVARFPSPPPAVPLQPGHSSPVAHFSPPPSQQQSSMTHSPPPMPLPQSFSAQMEFTQPLSEPAQPPPSSKPQSSFNHSSLNPTPFYPPIGMLPPPPSMGYRSTQPMPTVPTFPHRTLPPRYTLPPSPASSQVQKVPRNPKTTSFVFYHPTSSPTSHAAAQPIAQLPPPVLRKSQQETLPSSQPAQPSPLIQSIQPFQPVSVEPALPPPPDALSTSPNSFLPPPRSTQPAKLLPFPPLLPRVTPPQTSALSITDPTRYSDTENLSQPPTTSKPLPYLSRKPTLVLGQLPFVIALPDKYDSSEAIRASFEGLERLLGFCLRTDLFSDALSLTVLVFHHPSINAKEFNTVGITINYVAPIMKNLIRCAIVRQEEEKKAMAGRLSGYGYNDMQIAPGSSASVVRSIQRLKSGVALMLFHALRYAPFHCTDTEVAERLDTLLEMEEFPPFPLIEKERGIWQVHKNWSLGDEYIAPGIMISGNGNAVLSDGTVVSEKQLKRASVVRQGYLLFMFLAQINDLNEDICFLTAPKSAPESPSSSSSSSLNSPSPSSPPHSFRSAVILHVNQKLMEEYAKKALELFLFVLTFP